MVEPAWKRLGLKVKNVINNDPLAITTIRETITDNEVKKNKKDKKAKKDGIEKKRKHEKIIEQNEDKKDKKPAKRIKLPKSERLQLRKENANNFEKDQLYYLKQFKQDKENWKFSKQKQNWIIKNIKIIPENYESILFEYLDSIKGGSRNRIINDMKKVIDLWNEMVDNAEEQLKKDLEKSKEDEKVENTTDNKEGKEVESEENSKKQKKQKKQKKKSEIEKDSPPDYDFAIRAREIYKILSGEKLNLKSIDTVELEVNEKSVDVEDHI